MAGLLLGVFMGTFPLQCPAAPGLDPLPEGNTGIAANYPGDAGIAHAPGVVFSDDFENEQAPGSLETKWNAGVMHRVRIATESALVHNGGRALEFTVPKQSGEMSNSVMHTLSPAMDVVFLRCYTKFEDGFSETGSSHNGCSISGGYYVNGKATPGIRADGRNKFLVSTENGRDTAAEIPPGRLNSYVYWPEQGDVWGDHFYPTGEVTPFSYTRSGTATFGNNFVARPEVTPPLNVWFCYEVMVRLNTLGKRDGRIAVWMDGKLAADWPNLRLRDIPDLKADRISLDLHIKSNSIRANKKWYDDVVVATGYIGPMTPASPGSSVSKLP